jgi:hypothetical protein
VIVRTGLSYLSPHRFSKSLKRAALILIILTNLSLGSLALYASMHNYPGGEAVVSLSHLRSSSPGPLPPFLSLSVVRLPLTTYRGFRPPQAPARSTSTPTQP